MEKFRPWRIILISIFIIILLFNGLHGFIYGCLSVGIPYGWVCGKHAYFFATISIIVGAYFIFRLIKLLKRK
jgi:hypothetical protein